jgi:hypothetical protein
MDREVGGDLVAVGSFEPGVEDGESAEVKDLGSDPDG